MDCVTTGTSPAARQDKAMTSMTIRNFRVLPLLLLAGVSIAQAPQLPTTTTVTDIEASFESNVGVNNYGASLAMTGRAELSVTRVGMIPFAATVRLEDSLVGRGRLNGVNREAFAVTRFGQVGGSVMPAGLNRSYSAGFTIRIGGQTILSPTFSGTATTPLQWNSGTATYTFLQTTASLPTGLGFNVNLGLTGRASGSIGALMTVNPPNLTATLTGDARGVATGIASASVSVVFAEAGVQFQLNVLNTRLTPSITASYGNGMSGSFGYRVEPARFLINLFASTFGLGVSIPIVDISAPAIQGTRNLF